MTANVDRLHPGATDAELVTAVAHLNREVARHLRREEGWSPFTLWGLERVAVVGRHLHWMCSLPQSGAEVARTFAERALLEGLHIGVGEELPRRAIHWTRATVWSRAEGFTNHGELVPVWKPLGRRLMVGADAFRAARYIARGQLPQGTLLKMPGLDGALVTILPKSGLLPMGGLTLGCSRTARPPRISRRSRPSGGADVRRKSLTKAPSVIHKCGTRLSERNAIMSTTPPTDKSKRFQSQSRKKSKWSGPWTLTALTIDEVSHVDFPAQPGAKVLFSKGAAPSMKPARKPAPGKTFVTLVKERAVRDAAARGIIRKRLAAVAADLAALVAARADEPSSDVLKAAAMPPSPLRDAIRRRYGLP